MLTKPYILFVVSLLLSCLCASAQRPSAGMYNSVKGFGLSFSLQSEDGEMDVFTAYADIYGIPSGRSKVPGAKFNYSHQFVFTTLVFNDAVLDIYAGPGVTAGYVHDHESGFFTDYDKPLLLNMGVVGALSGTVGCVFSFSRKLMLDLSWTVEGGIHMRRDETLENIDLKLYKNGLTQAWMPQLVIRSFF